MRRAALALALGLLALAGCGESNGLSASSTCSQFMQAEIAERAQVTAQLYEAHHGASAMGSANALLDTEAICRDEPTTQLGSVPVLSGPQ
jgi:hypothetical protein